MTLPNWARTLLGFIAGVAGTLLAILLSNWLSLGEANLVYVGTSPPPDGDHAKLTKRSVLSSALPDA